jgi:hypothetical protein
LIGYFLLDALQALECHTGEHGFWLGFEATEQQAPGGSIRVPFHAPSEFRNAYYIVCVQLITGRKRPGRGRGIEVTADFEQSCSYIPIAQLART